MILLSTSQVHDAVATTLLRHLQAVITISQQ
jgi:hypothetical protein